MDHRPFRSLSRIGAQLKNALSLLVVVAAFLGTPSTGRASSTYGELRGTVIDWVTNRPIVGAKVTIDDEVDGPQAVTGQDGNFIIVAVPLGRHFLRVTAPDYDPVINRAVLICPNVSTNVEVQTQLASSGAHRDIVPSAPPRNFHEFGDLQDEETVTLSSAGGMFFPCW